MGVAVWIAIQAAATAATSPVPSPIQLAPRCPAPETDGGDVTVCGRPGGADRYRLKPLPPTAADPVLPKAAIRVFGNATLSGETEQVGVGGFPSNRAMVRLKIPF